MSRLVWAFLPAIALGASVADAWMPPVAPARPGTAVVTLPAAHPGDRLIAIGSTDLPADTADREPSFPVVGKGIDTPASDLGLAAAALANGPVTAASRRANGPAFVAPKAKARLPEPATWVMLIGGMYGIGAALRRRHRASEAAFTARVRAIAAEQDAAEDN